MSDGMRVNFGKYDIPPTLRILIDLREELGDAERFWRGLHFYLALEGFRYFNTPCDVVVFGNTGVDGIHYGFLTDFGSAPDLESAPVVCVSPMDLHPVRIVAGNIREFLAINLTDDALFYNDFESEDSYLEAKRQWAKEASESPYRPSEDEKFVREITERRLKDRLRLPLVDNPYRHVRMVGLERQRAVTIRTRDGMGVTAPLRAGETHVPFPYECVRKSDPDRLRDYLESAPAASRMALFRDIPWIADLERQHELRAVVLEAMLDMGLADEAGRLSDIR